VVAPIGLAVIVMAVGLAARAAWQITHGISVALPTPASTRLYGLLSYALGSWIAVALAWFWSTRREMQRDVFVFRKLTWPTLAASIAGSVIVILGVPIVTHALTRVVGGQSPVGPMGSYDLLSVAIVVFLFVVTTPVSEEVLYRGLLVAWLRRAGRSDLTILLFGSLIFAANHIIPLGLAWSAAMVLLGVVLSVLRLRYESLSPAWLAHALFNAQLTLSGPLSVWLARAL
jgi:membrane protease YdiL (CAAX protease family)